MGGGTWIMEGGKTAGPLHLIKGTLRFIRHRYSRAYFCYYGKFNERGEFHDTGNARLEFTHEDYSPYSSSNYYVGPFKNGKQHGKGVRIYERGPGIDVYGRWSEGDRVQTFETYAAPLPEPYLGSDLNH